MAYECRLLHNMLTNIHLPVHGVLVERGEVLGIPECVDAPFHSPYRILSFHKFQISVINTEAEESIFVWETVLVLPIHISPYILLWSSSLCLFPTPTATSSLSIEWNCVCFEFDH